MAFKLGSGKTLQASGGNIKSKFKFKQQEEVAPGVPVYKKKLDNGILAEANMDGSIYVNNSVDENDPMFKRIMNHEMQHVTKMKTGEETYDDSAVYFQGEVWPRGDGYVTDPNTGKKYKEGDKKLPWESNKI